MTRPLAGKTCLVLGAGGFIGINLTVALRQSGAVVRAFGRRPRYSDAPAADQWIEGEFHERDAIAEAVQGVTHVFHLLGGSAPAAHNLTPEKELTGNLQPSLALFEACAEARIERLVFASSGGTVYGPGAPVPTEETAQTNPISAYGVGKLALEKFLAVYRRYRGLDSYVLRLANPFGPWQDPLRGQGLVARAMQSAIEGAPIELWGDGSLVRDFIYVEDVADALVRAALHEGDERLFNIGSGIGRQLLAVLSDVSEVAGRPLDVRQVPGRAADVPISVLDPQLAASALAWEPTTSWLRGLQLTRDWLSARQG
ncbi:NAD-dependent epimerase/dehydratase family protein [Altererythrobacter sp. TH136]|uniref:NAD-dependent epimerase/dehydratase family protein n=1 Tax=Altererythrobacter sp. TH136 TaxID=2067415 RepID=UPI00116495FB|nr:NAD-dependent epimerase/dehydratase family protein [Altererythrobacter sp. TH136]QDM41023.1 NAD-dependent epimerase/dehydratase family protein [Altererythrobacter sp. TH136]